MSEEYLDLPYFQAPLDESIFEKMNKDQAHITCAFCGLHKPRMAELVYSPPLLPEREDLDDEAHVCPDCLREKKYGFAQEVEWGVLNENGITPISDIYPYKKDYDSYAELEKNEQSMQAIPNDAIEALRHTPPFRAWQGPTWLIHCNDFMTYIGTWDHEDFVRHSPDGDAEALYLAISDAPVEYEEQWGPNKSEYAECSFYAFRCRHCGALRGYVDNP